MARMSLTNATGFDGVPAGWYKGIVEKMSATYAGDQAKNPGAPMFHEIFRVTEGDHANRMIHKRWMLKEEMKGSARTKKMMSELAENPDDFDNEEVAERLTGVECWVQLSLRKNSAERAAQFGNDSENDILAHSLTDPTAGEVQEAATEPTPAEAASEETLVEAQPEETEPEPAPVRAIRPAAKPAPKVVAKAPVKPNGSKGAVRPAAKLTPKGRPTARA